MVGGEINIHDGGCWWWIRKISANATSDVVLVPVRTHSVFFLVFFRRNSSLLIDIYEGNAIMETAKQGGKVCFTKGPRGLSHGTKLEEEKQRMLI
jgi:hypothetical protein